MGTFLTSSRLTPQEVQLLKDSLSFTFIGKRFADLLPSLEVEISPHSKTRPGAPITNETIEKGIAEARRDLEALETRMQDLRESLSEAKRYGYDEEIIRYLWAANNETERLMGIAGDRIRSLEDLLNNTSGDAAVPEMTVTGEFIPGSAPKVVLYLGSMSGNVNWRYRQLVPTFIHEMFHARNFFEAGSARAVREIDEAMVEYATLILLNDMAKARGDFDDLYKHYLLQVRGKAAGAGELACYGFGAYLAENVMKCPASFSHGDWLKAYARISSAIDPSRDNVSRTVSSLYPFYPEDEEIVLLLIEDILFGTGCNKMYNPITNPWENVSINDTIANWDKAFINNLSPSVRSLIELRTLPEPYHGDPNASVYLLNGNPLAGANDLKYVGVPSYNKEIRKELLHLNTEFLWLRYNETIRDAAGNPYPAYKYWKDRTKELRAVKPHPSLFCIEFFPYHTLHASDFKKIPNLDKLPSNNYTNAMIYDAMSKKKYIVLMRCAEYWFKRIPELEKYPRLLRLNSSQSVYLTRKNLSRSLPTAKDWDGFLKEL